MSEKWCLSYPNYIFLLVRDASRTNIVAAKIIIFHETLPSFHIFLCVQLQIIQNN